MSVTALRPGRLPFGPAERFALAGRVFGDDESIDGYLAEVCGVPRRTVQRWRHRGLDTVFADRVATNIGMGPDLIWGQEWATAIDHDVAVALGCAGCDDPVCVCCEPPEQIAMPL